MDVIPHAIIHDLMRAIGTYLMLWISTSTKQSHSILHARVLCWTAFSLRMTAPSIDLGLEEDLPHPHSQGLTPLKGAVLSTMISLKTISLLPRLSNLTTSPKYGTLNNYTWAVMYFHAVQTPTCTGSIHTPSTRLTQF